MTLQEEISCDASSRLPPGSQTALLSPASQECQLHCQMPDPAPAPHPQPGPHLLTQTSQGQLAPTSRLAETQSLFFKNRQLLSRLSPASENHQETSPWVPALPATPDISASNKRAPAPPGPSHLLQPREFTQCLTPPTLLPPTAPAEEALPPFLPHNQNPQVLKRGSYL